ncbi:hypothetical protein BKI52_45140 [marine bacterium AO1-C]|nr:hypothetical protein BKI52_45140 [marine bacterium AO1-C]
MNIGQAILSTILLLVALTLVELLSFIPIVEKYVVSIARYYNFIHELLTLTLVYFFVRRFRLKDGALIQSTPIYWYLIAVGLAILFIFAMGPLSALFREIIGIKPKVVTHTQSNTSPYTFYYFNFIATALLAPIKEELFFREFQQKWLHQKHSPVVVIIVNALLFAAVHLPVAAWIFGLSNDHGRQAFIVFFGALLIGFVYHKSKSVGPTIALHITWNTLVTFY